jgi:hypothetical protein
MADARTGGFVRGSAYGGNVNGGMPNDNTVFPDSVYNSQNPFYSPANNVIAYNNGTTNITSNIHSFQNTPYPNQQMDHPMFSSQQQQLMNRQQVLNLMQQQAMIHYIQQQYIQQQGFLLQQGFQNQDFQHQGMSQQPIHQQGNPRGSVTSSFHALCSRCWHFTILPRCAL